MTNVVLSLPDTISLADAMAAFRALVHPGPSPAVAYYNALHTTKTYV